jgi:hypothetical protein
MRTREKKGGDMQEPVSPEEDLNQELKREEREIHKNLYLLHQIYEVIATETIPAEHLEEHVKVWMKELRKLNPEIAKEIDLLLASQDRKKMIAYFEKEKMILTQLLSDELKEHKQINRKVNDSKIEKFPTDS